MPPRSKTDKAEKAEKPDKAGKSGKDAPAPSRETALDAALEGIGKRFGPEAIMRLGAENVVKCDVISTGSLALDAAIGVGGIPKGRIVEFYGPESSGKTTLALHCVANAQRDGGTAAFIDAEHALDPAYSRKLGVDLDGLLVSQPDSGEQALEICEMLVKSNAVDIIVVDSVAALTPRAELEGEMGQSHVGLQARLMSQGLRKLTGIIKKSNCCVVFINQIRMKIGVLFGNPETTTGGNALKFYSSVRLDIRRGAPVKNKDEEIIGSATKVKVVKNKMAPPFKLAEFQVLFNHGVNRLGEVIDLGVKEGILGKTGSWLSYGETRIGQGSDKAMQFLLDNPAMRDEIEAKLKERLLDNVIAMPAAPAAGAENADAREDTAGAAEETTNSATEDEAAADVA